MKSKLTLGLQQLELLEKLSIKLLIGAIESTPVLLSV